MIPAAAVVLFAIAIGVALYALAVARSRSTIPDEVAAVLDSRLVPVFDELDLIYSQVRPHEGVSIWQAIAQIEASQVEFRGELVDLTERLDALAEGMAA